MRKGFMFLAIFAIVGMAACTSSNTEACEATTVDSTATTTSAPVVIESAPADTTAAE